MCVSPGLSPRSSALPLFFALSSRSFISNTLSLMHTLLATGTVDGTDTLLTVCAEKQTDAVKSNIHLVIIVDVS